MFDNREPQPPTILLVDDHVGNVRVLAGALAGFGEILFATSGSDALRIARARQPDLVLLDIEMPGLDGYAVCAELRTDPATADCRIIFVTAHSDSENELKSLASGGIDFLSKPLNVPVARARVDAQLTLKRQADELALARQDLSDIVHNLPVLITYWDTNLCNRFSNDTAGRWFGVPADRMLGLPMRKALGDQIYAAAERHIPNVQSGRTVALEATIANADGGIRHVQASLVASRNGTLVKGFILMLIDITDRKLAELALRDEKERIRVTLNSIGDAVIATDLDGRVTFMNPIAEDMTGWRGEDAFEEPIERIMPLCNATTGAAMRNPIRVSLEEERIVGMALDCVLRRPGMQEFSIEDSAAPIRDHTRTVTGAIIVFHDVSEARAMAIKMSHLAQHDALTDLPNRLLLQDRVVQAIQHARRNSTRVAMLLIDLDQFKVVNDTLGHTLGDELLQQVAARLVGGVNASDTVCRHGGDEFIVLLTDLESPEPAGSLAASLLERIEQPYTIREHQLRVTASIGISVFPDDCGDEEGLMSHADAAMYQAKRHGRHRYRFFSGEIEANTRARFSMQRRLQQAIDFQQFEVHYQTKVDVCAGKIVGAEALLRWCDETGQWTPPGDFIPLAEECELIIPIGAFVLEQACLQAKAWGDLGYPIPVSVNISVVQFTAPNFTELVETTLSRTGLSPTLLELEITESILVQDVEGVRSKLDRLHSLGITIAIDDFGTGYSSLAYLKRLPIDVLKIDQSFVRDMLCDASDAAIIAAVISLAKSLNLKLVAEGVETLEHVNALQSLGCNVMQGFYYSKPLPASAVRVRLTGPA